MRRTRLALAVAFVLVAAGDARAFVRTRTKAGAATAWRTPNVVLHVPPLTPERPVSRLSGDDVLASATASVAIWTHAQNACASVEAEVVEDAAPDAVAQPDRQNNLIFRLDDWSAQVLDKNGLALADYEPNQLALTSLFVRPSGEIIDGDIEINVFNHPAWERNGDMTQLLADGAVDLQNTLAHEFGHVLGFEHGCWNPTTGPRPVDEGAPIPACDEHPELEEATMAPTAPPGDVGKRSLQDDDRSALCTVYPFGKPVLLPPVDDGGCALAGPPDEGGAPTSLAPLLALAVLCVGRRRR